LRETTHTRLIPRLYNLFSFWIFVATFLSAISFGDEVLGAKGVEPKSIAVEEVISDKKIQKRLSDILIAVGSYQQVQVQVISGVAILKGLVDDSRQIEWANDLATRMDGVVAVHSKLKSQSGQ
jgi:osmotically-inducible protein OsmY